jgi:hypothetical protein
MNMRWSEWFMVAYWQCCDTELSGSTYSRQWMSYLGNGTSSLLLHSVLRTYVRSVLYMQFTDLERTVQAVYRPRTYCPGSLQT